MSASCVPRGDLCIYQGDTFAQIVVVTNADGTPADLTGYTARAQMRRAVADTEPEIALTIGVTIQSPNILLDIPNTATTGLSGTYKWDLELTTPTNAVMTILQGSVNITPEVTR